MPDAVEHDASADAEPVADTLSEVTTDVPDDQPDTETSEGSGGGCSTNGGTPVGPTVFSLFLFLLVLLSKRLVIPKNAGRLR